MHSNKFAHKKQNLQTTDENKDCHLMKLLDELLIHIFDYLQPKDLLQLTLTSLKLYNITTSASKLYSKWTFSVKFESMENKKKSSIDQIPLVRALIRSDRIFHNLHATGISNLEDVKHLLLLVEGFKDQLKSIELYKCKIEENDLVLLLDDLSYLKEIILTSCLIYTLDKAIVITPPAFHTLERITIRYDFYSSLRFEENEVNINFIKFFSNASQLNYAKLLSSKSDPTFLCNKENLKTLVLDLNSFFTEEDLSIITFSLESFHLQNSGHNDTLSRFLDQQPQLNEISLIFVDYKKAIENIIAMKNLKKLTILTVEPLNWKIGTLFESTNSSVEHLKLKCSQGCNVLYVNQLSSRFLGVKNLELDLFVDDDWGYRSIIDNMDLTFNSGDELENVDLTFRGCNELALTQLRIKNLHKVVLANATIDDLLSWECFLSFHPLVRSFETKASDLKSQHILAMTEHWKKLEHLRLDFWDNEITDRDLQTIEENCINLQELELVEANYETEICSLNSIMQILGEKFNRVQWNFGIKFVRK